MDFPSEVNDCFFFLVLDVIIAAVLVLAVVLKFRDLNERVEKIGLLCSAYMENSKQSLMQVSELKSCIKYYHEEIKEMSARLKTQDLLIKKLQAMKKTFAEANYTFHRVVLFLEQNKLEDEKTILQLAAFVNCLRSEFNQKREQVSLTAELVFDPNSKESSADYHRGEIANIKTGKFDQGDADNLMQCIRIIIKEALEEFHHKVITRENFPSEMKDWLNSMEDAGNAVIAEAFRAFLAKFQNPEKVDFEKAMNYIANYIDNSTRKVLSATNDLKTCLSYLHVNQTNLARESQNKFDERLNQLQKELIEAVKKLEYSTNTMDNYWLDENQMLEDIEIPLVQNF